MNDIDSGGTKTDPFQSARVKIDDPSESQAADMLYGAPAIKAYLIELGVPEETCNPYYLRQKRKWPIGKDGHFLVASKRRLKRHAEKITAA